MAVSTPTSEPTTARAGDTWTWQRSFSDYPATDWTLGYTLFKSGTRITFTASASGSDHLVTLAAATTAGYTAGRYDWVAAVTKGAERYQVDSGVVQILPNVATISAGYDGRSHARKMLDAIEATLEGSATASELSLVQAALGDRRMQHDPSALRQLRRDYAAQVAAEDLAAARAAGSYKSGLVQVRFS